MVPRGFLVWLKGTYQKLNYEFDIPVFCSSFPKMKLFYIVSENLCVS